MANQEKLIRKKAWLWPVARHMKMALRFASPAVHLLPPCACRSLPSSLHAAKLLKDSLASTLRNPLLRYSTGATCRRKGFRCLSVSAALPPLDLTEENVKQVLLDARNEFEQVFDTSVGMTGQVELAELDGPFVKLSLRGRFWHKRSTVLERLGTYLKNRIPEILEVDIEDEKQLDDSPENF